MKKIHPSHIPKPRWPPPYDKRIVIAGFRIIGYLGFLRLSPTTKKLHKYRVKCTVCGEEMDRWQAGLVRSEKNGQCGCNVCSNSWYKRSAREHQTEEDRQWFLMCAQWKWVLFSMPVTSLRTRAEFGRCADSDKVKVMGWHMI